MDNRDILISGASIAGPALALCLRRYGFRPTVVERAPALRDGGYKVDIRGSAIDVARRMGILDDIRAASTDIHHGTFVDGAGRKLATLGADFFAGRVGDDDEVMRGDLARILYDRTRSDTEYLFGDSITSITEDTDGVWVTFERSEPRTFDLVIGADGLHSHTRALTFGAESQFARHLGLYVSFFTVPNYLRLDHEELFHHMPGKLVNIHSARHNTEARAAFIFTAPPGSPVDNHRRDPAQQKRLLAEVYADAGWEVPRVLRHLADAPDFYFDSCTLIEMDRWSKGRVALVGDAAYCSSPMSGQGMGMGLVGAYVLAGELAAAGGDHHTAFARYEAEMRGYVAMNQRFAEKFTKELPQTARKVRMQNLMIRMLPYLPWKGLIAGKIAEEIQRAAKAITVKDYAMSLA